MDPVFELMVRYEARLAERRQVAELRVIHALVLELRWYRAGCANCGTRAPGEPPPGSGPA